MSRPWKCPVCQGQGTVSRPPFVAGDVPGWTTSGTQQYACRACGGTGIVWKPEPPTQIRVEIPAGGLLTKERQAMTHQERAERAERFLKTWIPADEVRVGGLTADLLAAEFDAVARETAERMRERCAKDIMGTKLIISGEDFTTSAMFKDSLGKMAQSVLALPLDEEQGT